MKILLADDMDIVREGIACEIKKSYRMLKLTIFRMVNMHEGGIT